VLAFTAGTAALSAILVTLVPAWRSARQEPAAALQQNARALTNTGRTGKALIVTQVALSVVLLTDAALLVRTLQNLRSVRYGFDPEGVSLAGLFPEVNGYQDFDPDRYEPELVARVAALPGVRVAALTRARPGFLESKQLVALAGSTGANVRANFGPIGPRFLEALRVPLLAGRDLQWSDNSRSRRVALVSRSLAERLMPGGDVLGRRVRIGTDPGRRDLEIVGVVGDARLYDPRDPDPNTVYVPMLQEATYTKWATLIVRADAPIAAAGLRERVRSLRRESLLAIGPLQRTLDRAILQERVTAMIAGFFGALAALLAAIGLYGLMAYAVAQRRREIGVRLALGARPGEVIRMVVLETMGLVVAGVAVGVPLALATSRAVRSLLFGLSPGDPVTIIGIVAMLLLIGAVAGFVPGRLASRINPIDALRV
jgi:predicted permease